MQLVLSWLEEDGDGVVVVLGSFEGQVKRETRSGVASLPAGGVIDTSLVAAVHIDQHLMCTSRAKSDHWQSQHQSKETIPHCNWNHRIIVIEARYSHHLYVMHDLW